MPPYVWYLIILLRRTTSRRGMTDGGYEDPRHLLQRSRINKKTSQKRPRSFPAYCDLREQSNLLQSPRNSLLQHSQSFLSHQPLLSQSSPPPKAHSSLSPRKPRVKSPSCNSAISSHKHMSSTAFGGRMKKRAETNRERGEENKKEKKGKLSPDGKEMEIYSKGT